MFQSYGQNNIVTMHGNDVGKDLIKHSLRNGTVEKIIALRLMLRNR